MAREQIQINDLEPSIIGEDVTRYAIQIRGVDGNGNEGPWSTILEYESPELLPSLQSSNYVEGEEGWFLDNDGTFEVNDGFIRGTLQSANYIPNTSGWALDVGGNVEFSSGLFRGALQIGQNTFNVDSNGNLFIGGSTFNNSPFAVNTNGQIQAMAISANFISAGFLSVDRLEVNSINGNRITNGSISAGKIGNLEITADKIANLTIDASKIMNLQINSDKIGNGAVGTAKIANLAVTNAKIANLAVTDAKIASLSANKITAGTITGIQLNGVGIRANTVDVSFPGSANFSVIRANSESSMGLTNFYVQLRNSGIIARTGTTVVATGNGTFGISGSSIKFKENVRDAGNLETLLNIRPVFFDYKRDTSQEQDDPTRLNIYGAIAEELDELGLRSLVYYDEEGPKSIDYEKIGLALIPYVKELYDRIDELERKVNGS